MAVQSEVSAGALTLAAPERKQRTLWGDVWRRFRRHKLAILGLIVFVILLFGSAFGPMIYDVDPEAIDIIASSQPPSLEHPFGTDDLGRDLLARNLYGGRISLSVGVVAMLMAFGSSLNMFSIIGIVMLMGLVTKNAILLVDFAIRSRAEGMDRNTALLHAAKVRLRPILMTTLAMVFGMVPLAFAVSEGSEQRAPMGQAVIGGVITSSLLTLVVVPVVYGWLDDLAAWARRGFKRSVSGAA